MNTLTLSGPKIKLIAFLYDLMRDELPLGVVHKLMLDSMTTLEGEDLKTVEFTNEHLARYAERLANMLVPGYPMQFKLSELREHEEGDNEDLGPLSQETRQALEDEHGITFPAWTPTIITDESVPIGEVHIPIFFNRDEPCPNCGCPGREFDGHACEEWENGERLAWRCNDCQRTATLARYLASLEYTASWPKRKDGPCCPGCNSANVTKLVADTEVAMLMGWLPEERQ